MDQCAHLSYADMGPTDAEFQSLGAVRIQSMLEAAPNQRDFIAVDDRIGGN